MYTDIDKLGGSNQDVINKMYADNPIIKDSLKQLKEASNSYDRAKTVGPKSAAQRVAYTALATLAYATSHIFIAGSLAIKALAPESGRGEGINPLTVGLPMEESVTTPSTWSRVKNTVKDATASGKVRTSIKVGSVANQANDNQNNQ